MNPFKPCYKHLNGAQKRTLKTQQERSVAKLLKINSFFSCALSTSSIIQQDSILGPWYQQNHVCDKDSDQRPQRALVNKNVPSLYIFIVLCSDSLVVNK